MKVYLATYWELGSVLDIYGCYATRQMAEAKLKTMGCEESDFSIEKRNVTGHKIEELEVSDNRSWFRRLVSD